MSRGLLIHNSKAGKQSEELLPSLLGALGDIESVSLEELGEAKNARDRATALGCQWIAVAGGDGTVEGVAASLVGSDVPLGIIPTGTYNNFARSLDLPLDPVEACAIIIAGKTRRIDVGKANGALFFECLGSGLDAALYPISEDIKSGHLSRFFDFCRRAYSFRKQRFTLTFDRPINEALSRDTINESRHLIQRLGRNNTSELTLSALMLTVSNGPYFGMNFAIAPHQRMDDGLLTVTVFSRYSKLQLWWHFFSVAFGRRDYRPKSISFRVSKIQIGGPRKLPVHLDGTPQKGLWPLEIECLPGALAVFR